VARRYFGTDGVRGRMGVGPITPEFVLKLGWASGKVFGAHGGSNVLIGKDTRISGYLLESALQAGLAAAGVGVRLLGPMPTPGIAYLTRTLHAQAGIVISASHNPYYDNGIKFFSGTGYKLPDGVEEEIERYLDQPMTCVESADLGKAERVRHAAGRYIEFCKSSVPPLMTLHGLRLVVDCAHGATYHIAPHVFTELGAEVAAIGVSPDGLNINRECGSTSLDAVRAAVLENRADLGLALDGDGDRVLLIDSSGRLVDGDDMLFIIARARQSAGELPGNRVVGTQMTNLGLEKALAGYSISLERARVGDRYVLERLIEGGWVLGGEPSGHVICLDRTSTGDGIVAALQVIAEMQRTGKGLGDLAAGVEKFPHILVNVELDRPVDLGSADVLWNEVREVEARLGCDGRVVLRPSGTEAMIRVMVEGADEALVRALSEQLADSVRRLSV